MKAMKLFLLITGMLLLSQSGTAGAETQFLCSITESLECSEGVGCDPPELTVAPPTFFHVNLERKIITLLAPAERRGEETVIEIAKETPDGWLLAGVESTRAWSVYLSHAGHLTISVTMDGTIWSTFGRCMPAPNAEP